MHGVRVVFFFKKLFIVHWCFGLHVYMRMSGLGVTDVGCPSVFVLLLLLDE